MSELMPRLSSGDDRVRADLTSAEVPVVLGEPATIDVEVTNVDHMIRAYRVAVLGMDERWVHIEPAELDLFPGERREVRITLLLPDSYPSGRRRIAVEVTEPGAESASPIVLDVDLVLDPRDGLAMTVEPATLETGRTGTFVLSPLNTGNTTLDVGLRGADPERIVELTFDPPIVRLVPGERDVVQVTAVGKRPWFGMPLVRMLDLTAYAGDAQTTVTAALLQRPRISRRLLTIAGLLLAVTVFALVIMLSFQNVADLADQNAALLKQGLGEDGLPAGRLPPAAISGRVTSTTGGGIDGVAVELYNQANPIVPAVATVTDSAGGYRFSAVPDGTYVLRFAVAGFGQVWWPAGETVADADPFEIEQGVIFEEIDVALAGQPGGITGNVLAREFEGAIVIAQLPATAIEGSDLDPLPAVVASAEVDGTGAYELLDLATPATYELLVELPGFASEVRTISLGPGEQRSGVDMLLRRGDGRIAGIVRDITGAPLSGVVISATDGETETVTRTLSGDGVAGTFELRDLPTPGTYTLSVLAEGFFPATVTVTLEAEAQRDDVEVLLTSDVGSLSGSVFDAVGIPLGGVEVVVVGADVERLTVSLSTGEVGAWQVDGLPVPASYTVTFRQEGRTTQAVSVELTSGPEANRTGIDARLGRATSSVQGIVLDDQGQPLGGVEVVLSSTEVTRSTLSADRPVGTYRFDDIPPDAYTLTFTRIGSTPQTLLIELRAGQDFTAPPVTLERQASITGTVRRAGIGETGIGVVVYKFDDFPAEVTARTITGAQGRFEIVGLDAPETYLVEFQIPAGGPVAGSRTVFVLPGQTATVEADFD